MPIVARTIRQPDGAAPAQIWEHDLSRCVFCCCCPAAIFLPETVEGLWTNFASALTNGLKTSKWRCNFIFILRLSDMVQKKIAGVCSCGKQSRADGRTRRGAAKSLRQMIRGPVRFMNQTGPSCSHPNHCFHKNGQEVENLSKQWIALIPAYKPSEVLLQLLKEAVANDFTWSWLTTGDNKPSGAGLLDCRDFVHCPWDDRIFCRHGKKSVIWAQGTGAWEIGWAWNKTQQQWAECFTKLRHLLCSVLRNGDNNLQRAGARKIME